ncbi:MAG: DNA-binding protein WhiA [Clostridiales bacterium]|nr:DNA-binding protein WhiA [Clostridiales bacterium]
MSFSSEIKQELNKNTKLSNKELVKYELIGYLISGNIDMPEKNAIRFSTESDYNINRFSKLLANLQIDHKIEISGKNFVVSLKKKAIQEIVKIEEKEIFFKNEIQQENSRKSLENQKNNESNKSNENNEENLKSLIIGAFMGSGSINNPEKKYHLEIDFENEENLEKIKDVLEKLGIRTKKMITENKKSIYIKEGEEISKFLALIGANKAVMKFEDIRIQKEMRGKVNRLVNCETANLNKTINASIEQIAAIKKLKETGKFNKLNDNLKEIANLRLENPDMPLVELGKRLKEPVGKSGVNYRLKKIMELANE